jgi:membrane protein DedA with SNARE-associated domain
VPDVAVLLLTALLHEDVALFSAGLFIAERRVPAGVALAAVYVGVIANNYMVYLLGGAARRLPWLRRWLIGEKIERVRTRLQRRLLPTLALCRFMPGLLSPTLLGCGWLGIAPMRFIPAMLLAAALYVPLVLTIVTSLGEAVFRRVGKNAWWVLLAFAVATLCGWTLVRLRRPRQ